jgi:hypothetical protein
LTPNELQALWESHLHLTPGTLAGNKTPKHQPPAPGSGLKDWVEVDYETAGLKPTVAFSAPSLVGLSFAAVEAQAAALHAQFQQTLQASLLAGMGIPHHLTGTTTGRYSKAKPKPAPPPPAPTMIVGNSKRRIAL